MSDIIKAADAVKRALYCLQHSEDYCYLYGAKMQRLSDSLFEELWAAEPSYFKKYSAAQKAAIKSFCKKPDGSWKIATDCSGFVSYCVGDNTWSGGLWANCVNRKADPYQGKYASLLYRQGHIGIDLGYGFFAHAPSELHSIELGRIKDGLVQWTGTGEHKYVDYSEADNR